MGPMRTMLASLCVLVLAACSGAPSGAHRGSPSDERRGPPSAAQRRSASVTQRHATAQRPASGATADATAVPRFAHIVVVVEENRSYGEVIGNKQAPYINRLARSGALLTRAYGITHPSEPNYLALFSGSTHGLTDDSCPHRYRGGDLGAQLRRHGMRFAGYAESLSHAGYLGCSSGEYARKHAPWTDFANLPATVGRPMSAFPTHYARLPRVAFVVPNLVHDMHDGTIAAGDTWLRRRLGGYVSWARTHNSLLVLTWDEDDLSAGNHIPTLLAGAHVRRTHLGEHVDHYRTLRTIEAACGLPALGAAARRRPITGVWTS